MTQPKQFVLITGGSSGIGAATARRFSKQGAAVAILARHADAIDSVVKEIRAAKGEALGIPADLWDPETPQTVMDFITTSWGKLDVLVNNAAAIKHLPVDQATPEVFEMHYAVNVRAPYFLVQAALPLLKKSVSPWSLRLSVRYINLMWEVLLLILSRNDIFWQNLPG